MSGRTANLGCRRSDAPKIAAHPIDPLATDATLMFSCIDQHSSITSGLILRNEVLRDPIPDEWGTPQQGLGDLLGTGVVKLRFDSAPHTTSLGCFSMCLTKSHPCRDCQSPNPRANSFATRDSPYASARASTNVASDGIAALYSSRSPRSSQMNPTSTNAVLA